MKQQSPAVLLVAVAACAVVLYLQQTGVFARASAHWLNGQNMLPWQYAYQTAVAFVTAMVCAGMQKQGRALLFVGAVMFLTATLAVVLRLRGFAFEPLSGWLAAALAGLGGLWLSGSEKGSRVRAFREFFVGRLQEDVFSELVMDREPVKLSSQRELTTVTCRVVNLPTLANTLQADEVEGLVSLFQQEVAEQLVMAGGFLDSSSPAGVVVQFGFPVLRADHSEAACRAALNLKSKLVEVAASARERWKVDVEFGIGVASGKAVCGLMGYEEFQSYRVVGVPVESSLKLCELNAVYGSRVLVTSEVMNAVRDELEVRPVEMALLPGQDKASEVYELLAPKGGLTDEATKARDAFWKGVVALRGGQKAAAKGHFEAAKVEGVEDKPLAYFLKQTRG
jgi:class 3 adenylate cyclase